MAAVKQKHTRPELSLRKALHAAGYRYRLHLKHLPGRPDISFPGRKLAVFVHGCFWHGHECRKGRRPATNQDYWLAKIEENQARDRRKVLELEALGWKVITVWECHVGGSGEIPDQLERWLLNGRTPVRRGEDADDQGGGR